MTTPIALIVFVASLTVLSWTSDRLTSVLERIGARFRLTDGLLGLLVAFGADAPSISSAFVALLSRQNEIGLGVVLGSNIFNLAGLLGLSAIVAGRVTIGREGLWLNGGVSLYVSGLVVMLILGWIPAGLCTVLLLLVLIPYVTILALRRPEIARFHWLPPEGRRFLETAIGHAHRDTRKRENVRHATRRDAFWTGVLLVLIVGTSAGAVKSAVALGDRWGISPGITGMLVLAALTSIPNLIAAVQLAREGKGAAVVTEALNSNTLNILAGVCLPALLIGFGQPTGMVIFSVFWLVAMKAVAIGASSHRRGLHRVGGGILLAMYVVFAVVVVLN